MTKRSKSLIPSLEEKSNFSSTHQLFSKNYFSHLDIIEKLKLIEKLLPKSLNDPIELYEHQTWDLFINLFLDRTSSAEMQNNSCYYNSEKEILNQVYSEDTQLRELQIVLMSLEKEMKQVLDANEGKFDCLFSKTNSWENTKHVMENTFVKQISNEQSDFKELHPDSQFCTIERLHKLDIDEERKFLDYLLVNLRAGDLAKIQKLCISRGEIWRALLFEGWRPFHFARITGEASDDTEVDEGFNDDLKMPEDQLHCEGNPSRNLFKFTCLHNSNNNSMSSPNRGIYAALCGNLNVLLENMPQVRDESLVAKWENYLWAHIRCFIETKTQYYIESKLNPTPHSKTYSVTGSCLDSGFSSKWSHNWPLDYFSLIDLNTSQLLTRVSSKSSWDPVDFLTKLLDQYQDPSCFDNTTGASVLGMNTTMASQLGQKSAIMSDSAIRSINGLSDTLSAAWHVIVRQAVILREYQDISKINSKLLKALCCYGLGYLARHPIVTIFTQGSGRQGDVNVSRNISRSQSISRNNLTISLRQTRNSLSNSMRLANKSTLRNQATKKFSSEAIEDPKRKPFKELLRFTVFLYATLRRFNEPIDLKTFELALEAYLAILIADDYPTDLLLQLISMFKTPEKRVAWLSFHFYKLDSPEMRKAAIDSVSDFGVDLHPISFAVIRLLRRNNNILSFEGIQQSNFEKNTSVNQIFDRSTFHENQATFVLEDEDNLIKCFHWLYFDQNFYVHLLRLANTAFRHVLFNDSDNIDIIQRIKDQIPGSIYELVQIQLKHKMENESDQNSPEDKLLIEMFKSTLNEHHSYLLYFEFIKEFNAWYKMYNSGFSLRVENSSSSLLTRGQIRKSITEKELAKSQNESKQKWLQDLQVQANQAQSKLLDMWSSTFYGWLVDPDTQDEIDKHFLTKFHDEIDVVVKSQKENYEDITLLEYSPQVDIDYLGERPHLRRQQLDRLRSDLIVKSVNKLAKILQCSNMHQGCVQLADLLIDPRLSLYEHFTKEQLGDFLKDLANSSIILQADHEDVFGSY